jgi:hypothetical protein
MRRVLMNFMFRDGWTVHFLEADCRTALKPGRFYDVATLERVRALLTRANATPETFAEFDHNVRAWSRGSVYLDLTVTQYARLKR